MSTNSPSSRPSNSVFAIMRYRENGKYCFFKTKVFEWVKSETTTGPRLLLPYGLISGIGGLAPLQQDLAVGNGVYEFMALDIEDNAKMTTVQLNATIPNNRALQGPPSSLTAAKQVIAQYPVPES